MTKRKESGAVRKTGAIQGDNHSFALLKNEGNVKGGRSQVHTVKKRKGKFERIYPG
jgi:hypothetical protein